MLEAQIRRTQYAVGHGGFHTGNVKVLAPSGSDAALEDFWYVYDCGSEERSAFTRELTAHRRESRGRTDVLFVSHLHSDHINGIERLLAAAPARKVVVPYLDRLERLVFLLGDIETGQISTAAREYFEDPVGWWARRGVAQVIFLEPGDGDDESPGGFPEPDAPFGGSGEDRTRYGEEIRKDPAAAMATRLRKPRLRPPAGVTSAGPAGRPGRQKPALLAGAGSHFALEWKEYSQAASRNGDWILLPYVHPVETKQRTTFRRDVNALLGIGRHNEAEVPAKLGAFLTDFAKTKQLVDLYGDHFGRGHNAVSMSLYSGPSFAPDAGQIYGDGWERQWHETDTDWDSAFAYLNDGRAVGWLTSGDAELKQSHRRVPWLRFYEPFSGQISILNLPHHGSRRNFHEDILDFRALSLTVATTVPRRKRIAGLRETLDLVEASRKAGYIVDAQAHTRLQISCQRRLRR